MTKGPHRHHGKEDKVRKVEERKQERGVEGVQEE